MVFQGLKSIVLFGLMYWSLKYLGVAEGAALVTSTIPLALGLINVMTGTAFSIAGLVFVLAAFSALLPSKYRNGLDFAEQIFNIASLDRGANPVTTDKAKTKQDETSIKAK